MRGRRRPRRPGPRHRLAARGSPGGGRRGHRGAVPGRAHRSQPPVRRPPARPSRPAPGHARPGDAARLPARPRPWRSVRDAPGRPPYPPGHRPPSRSGRHARPVPPGHGGSPRRASRRPPLPGAGPAPRWPGPAAGRLPAARCRGSRVPDAPCRCTSRCTCRCTAHLASGRRPAVPVPPARPRPRGHPPPDRGRSLSLPAPARARDPEAGPSPDAPGLLDGPRPGPGARLAQAGAAPLASCCPRSSRRPGPALRGPQGPLGHPPGLPPTVVPPASCPGAPFSVADRAPQDRTPGAHDRPRRGPRPVHAGPAGPVVTPSGPRLPAAPVQPSLDPPACQPLRPVAGPTPRGPWRPARRADSAAA